jgi:predicted dehydrogenase
METAVASAERFGFEIAFDDIATMAAHPDIDLVVVALRVPSHRDTVLAVSLQGKAVLCEWPSAAISQRQS